ncbi:type II toxin-antitoxin system RelE/ParE family toxin [Desulfobacterota bacterium AH_259_B03_O07]|nr:type II toxin-antitoxin system RelE/ParE family toxin [Desulfobacterota bacterium AH_259_B03_O07]
MVLFQAEFSTRANKHIKKLDKLMKKRIKDKIDNLEEDPFPKEVERVQDFEHGKAFRVRVGNHRILYLVEYNPNRLIIAKVDKRPRVYQ